jgi:SNF2-related domain/Helicase conserved C-terminal domain
MSLANKLGSQFERRLQDRGRNLLNSGAVHVTEQSANHIYATVQGSELYEVRINYERDARNRDNLVVSCTCAYFADFSRCKHVWAVVLEAGRRHALLSAEYARFLRVDRQPVNGHDSTPQAGRVLEMPRTFPRPERTPPWQEYLKQIQLSVESHKPASEWPTDLNLLYVIDPHTSRSTGTVVLELYSRTRKKTGEWTAWKEFRVSAAKAGSLPDPIDADLVPELLGSTDTFAFNYSATYASSLRKAVPYALALKLLPRAGAAGRLAVRAENYEFQQVEWDAGDPWKLLLEVRQDERDQWAIQGALTRGEERMPLSEPSLILPGGFVLARGRIARLEDTGQFGWIEQLLSLKRIPFPDREREAVLANLLDTPALPQLELDEPLRFEERRTTPRFALRISQQRNASGEDSFQGRLLMDYGSGWVQDPIPGRGVWLPAERVFLQRDPAAERAARDQLRAAGLRGGSGGTPWSISAKIMPRAVRELLQAGWHVEADGKAFRRASGTRVDVTSGIDWFELRGEIDYGGATAKLPDLLAALRRGETMVRLGDGSFGLLPEEWLARFAPLANLGTREEDHLRFRTNQAGLLDALLAAQPEVHVDEVFDRARTRLREFSGVTAAPQPEGFQGQLRDYQREGLGWMHFLREFGFGGCLADDMGVGKTAQVLALLESRRLEGKGPSLVVAPKSLMFNWREEAARFTPNLRVLEHLGTARDMALIGEHNLILTTYGTMLRDAPRLAEINFDYVVLDEAQAVKNASTASSKAVRLLRGDNRLALSGTPVENHLGELWSLFEFLNPGMLGEARVLQMAGGLGRNPGEEARKLLSQALRPFILRRTKQQVARELPEKTEQTIFCELEGAQKKQYDDLRRHYRDTLLLRVEAEGLGRAKLRVLEALLRLRQAACHPGLLDEKRIDEGSAKIDTLLDQIDEVLQEGHKALVFSQFTSLLAILRRRLDEKSVRYEYLDGQTRDRQERVEAFQSDPECGLFLISLKAGGLGLNLTAAEYVFLLDPWWNPAVEAQAIDRAHRIGQTRPVFAYRLIARDTVEEKVLELQKTKRELADAILGEDNSLIRNLKREDLELLLS